jgi:uncharacterized protein YciI
MPATEPCYVVEAAYAPGAAEKRKPHREAHVARLANLSDEGALVLAGAFDDLSASLLVFAVGSEEAVAAIVETDVYWKHRVWTSYTVRRLNRVLFEDA